MRATITAMLSKSLFITFALLAASGSSWAVDPFPSQPIKLVVGFSAGSATDVVARILGQRLSQRLGQPVLIDNKTGAGGSLAADAVAKSPPDGYTLLAVSSAIAVNPAVYPKLSFDVLNDLTPISLLGRVPLILLVNQSVPAKTLSELILYAKAQPGKLNYGSSGQGGSAHMSTELFAMTTGIKITHVPYRGNGQAATALLAGDVEVLMDTVINAMPQINSPRLRPIAITGEKRSPLTPQVPTFRELGFPGLDASLFFGIMGPANMPPAVVDRLNKEIAAILKEKDVEQRLSESGGMSLVGSSPEEFRSVLRDDLTMWKKVAMEAKVVVQ
jgi:tripartite-type tricarboxylate transporter receptor subunit TctC